MSERNEFLEMDGLYFESETHEWFNDEISTKYAHKNSILWRGGEQNDALPNIHCFVIREKSTGRYMRVVMDAKTNEIIFDTESMEQLSGFIDKMKLMKRFK